MNGAERRLRKALLVAIAVLALLVVVLAVAIAHQRLVGRRVTREIREQKQLTSRYGRDLRDCERWRKDYRAYSIKLGGRLPECSWSEQTPFMVSQLAGIVEPRGLKLVSIRPEPMCSSGKILRFPMKVNLQCDLAVLSSLLEDVEKTAPALEMDRLNVRNAQDKSGKLQVDMTISSFVVLDENAPLVKRRAILPARPRADVVQPSPASARPQPSPVSGKAESAVQPDRAVRPASRPAAASGPAAPVRIPAGATTAPAPTAGPDSPHPAAPVRNGGSK